MKKCEKERYELSLRSKSADVSRSASRESSKV